MNSCIFHFFQFSSIYVVIEILLVQSNEFMINEMDLRSIILKYF